MTDWLTAIASVISALFVPTAILVASRQWREMLEQTRHANRAIVATSYQGLASQLQEIDLVFVNHPELRPFFYENTPVPADDERHRVMAVAELLVDFMDNVVSQSDVMSDEHRDVWFRYFQDQYDSSPAIREYWLANSGWYRRITTEVIATQVESRSVGQRS